MEEQLADLLNWLTPKLQRLRPGYRRHCGSSGWALGEVDTPGKHQPGKPVALEDVELDRHLYVLGASGSGKSRLLELLMRQHLEQGAGFGLIDPHGDLTQSLLAYLHERTHSSASGGSALDPERVILVEPFRDDGLVGLNVLDPNGGPLYPHVGELVGIFRRFWASSWGPRMEEILRNCLLALALTGRTLTEVTPFLTDPVFREQVLTAVSDTAVGGFWGDRFESWSEPAKTAAAEPVLNKMGALLADPRLRALLGQAHGGLNVRAVMDGGSWLLLNCAKGHLRDAAYLLGSFLVATLQSAALSRADTPEADRRRFTLFVDEFQHFRGEDIETILCEARKYRLRLVFAHQHLAQLTPSLQSAVFGNVATRVVFAVSAQDASVVARGLGESSALGETLLQLPVGIAFVQRRGHGVVRTRIRRVITPAVDETALADFAASLRCRHGRPLAEIEAEIERRRGTTSAPAATTPKRPRKSTPKRPKPAADPAATTKPAETPVGAPAAIQEPDDA